MWLSGIQEGAGKLIGFMFQRNGSRKQFSIANDGWIVDEDGKLVKDTPFGLYTCEKIKSSLPKLKEQKSPSLFDDIKATHAVSSSPLTN